MSSGAPRRKRPRAHEEEEHENSERWMVSYADMVTLLMCLFIVMFAMSQIDQKKFESLAAGLAHGFGAPTVMTDAGGTSPEDGVGPKPIQLDRDAGVMGQPASGPAPPSALPPAQAIVDRQRARDDERIAKDQLAALREAQRRLARALRRAGYSGVARYRIDERGLTVSIVTDKILFAPARADLKASAHGILDAVGPVLRSLPNDLVIEGHTNALPLPASSPIPSNWELSTDRATRVLRYLIGNQHVPPSRLAAAGYAAERPLVRPGSPTGLRVNRRVDVVVLSTAPAEANALLPHLNAAAIRTAHERRN